LSFFTGLATGPPNESKNDISFDESHEPLFSGAASTEGVALGDTLECGCTGEVDAFGGNDADLIGKGTGTGLSTGSLSRNFDFSNAGVEGVMLEGRLPYDSANDCGDLERELRNTSGIVDDLLGDFTGIFSIAVSNPPNMSIELSFGSCCDTLFTNPGLGFALVALPPKASKKDMSFDDNQESIVSDLDTAGDVKGDEVVCACSMAGGELTNSVGSGLADCFSDITLDDSDREVASISVDIF
jgi:hypothetical protein